MDQLVCASICIIQEATALDKHLQDLKAYIIKGWPHKKEDVARNIQKYWPIRCKLAIKDGVAMKGKGVIIPSQLQT